MIYTFALKGLVAFICGFFIGLEREIKGKSAGLRTSVLICIGSALFTATGYEIVLQSGSGDPTRVFAQIVSGIGFLGAGVIIQSNGGIYGLTTASTIWITSAIGVAIGVGFEKVAIFSTFMTVGTLILLKVFESKVLYGFNLIRRSFNLDIVIPRDSLEVVEATIKNSPLIIVSKNFSAEGEIIKANFRLSGNCKDNDNLNRELLKLPQVKSLNSQKV